MYNGIKLYDIYAQIPGFSNYLISAKGKILNKKTNKFLKPYWRDKKKTYLKVTLTNDLGEIKNLYIHKLVVSVFGDINGIKDLTQDIDHINRDKFDNSIFNLEVVSHKENIDRYFAIKRGEMNG